MSMRSSQWSKVWTMPCPIRRPLQRKNETVASTVNKPNHQVICVSPKSGNTKSHRCSDFMGVKQLSALNQFGEEISNTEERETALQRPEDFENEGANRRTCEADCSGQVNRVQWSCESRRGVPQLSNILEDGIQNPALVPKVIPAVFFRPMGSIQQSFKY